jgi:hypothetical protein
MTTSRRSCCQLSVEFKSCVIKKWCNCTATTAANPATTATSMLSDRCDYTPAPPTPTKAPTKPAAPPPDLGSVCWCTSGAAVGEGVLHCDGNSCSCYGGVVFIIFVLSAFARGDRLVLHAGDDTQAA